jgi:Zn finger protein HypA/HybF involved in hydrogenase expression
MPKMGKWIKSEVRGQMVPCCSKCGLSNGTLYEYNYCPECGAKMQEIPTGAEGSDKE